MARQVVTSQVEVAGELDRLGIPQGILQAAARQGLAAAALYRAAKYPVIMPGFVAWGETLGSLRTGLIELRQGWEGRSKNSYETAVNVERGIALGVAAGDERTGLEGPDPATRSAKGVFTQRAAAANQTSLSLWTPEQPQTQPGLQTWLLLFAYAGAEREIRLELSLPLRMTSKRVRSWDERILIPAAPFELPPLAETGGGGGDEGPDVEVRRRA